jgi:hypothetical protein
MWRILNSSPLSPAGGMPGMKSGLAFARQKLVQKGDYMDVETFIFTGQLFDSVFVAINSKVNTNAPLGWSLFNNERGQNEC